MQTARITQRQVLFLTMGVLTGTSTLLPPAPIAGPDQWLAILLGGLMGLGLSYVYEAIWRALRAVRGEDVSKAAATQPAPVSPGLFVRAGGPWWGRVLAAAYWVFFTHLSVLVLYNLTTSIGTSVLPRTPTHLLVAGFVGLAAWSASQGTEGVARLAEVTIPLTFLASLSLVGLSALTPGLLDLRRLLPILDQGWLPLARGSWQAFSFPFAELVVIVPFGLVSRPPRATGVAVRRGILLTAGMLALLTGRNIAAVGASEAGRLVFPGFAATELIRVGSFIERIDAIALFIWINAGFIKLALTMLAAAQSFFDLVGLERRQETTPVLLAMGLLIGTLSVGLYRSPVDQVRFAEIVYPVYAPWFEIGGLLVLWLLSRRRQPVAPAQAAGGQP